MNTNAPTTSVSVSSRRQRNIIVVSSMVGSTLEYYEFFVYGTMAALAFGHLFFPSDDPTAGTLASFVTFAVGFVARPIGSLLAGHFGDKLGRKGTLATTLLAMGIATVLIGVLPTAEQVGILAPVLLVVLRLVQGLALGGEWGGAALMLVESVPANRRGRMGSLVNLGVPAGLLLASGVTSLSVAISGDSFLVWGWRLPFLASAVLVAVALVFRFAVSESPAFVQAEAMQAEAPKAPIGQVFRDHWRDLLLSLGIGAPANALFFLVSTFTTSYAVNDLHIAQGEVLGAQAAAAAVYVVTIPFFGALADRIAGWRVVLLGAVACAVFIPLYFVLLDTGDVLAVFAAMAIGMAVIHAALQAPQASVLSSRFPTRVRYTGVAFAQTLPTTIVGGTVPYLATLFVGMTGNTVLVVGYVVVLSLIGIGCATAFGRSPRRWDTEDARATDSDVTAERARRAPR